jgi:hypothetical protein
MFTMNRRQHVHIFLDYFFWYDIGFDSNVKFWGFTERHLLSWFERYVLTGNSNYELASCFVHERIASNTDKSIKLLHTTIDDVIGVTDTALGKTINQNLERCGSYAYFYFADISRDVNTATDARRNRTLNSEFFLMTHATAIKYCYSLHLCIWRLHRWLIATFNYDLDILEGQILDYIRWDIQHFSFWLVNVWLQHAVHDFILFFYLLHNLCEWS